MDVFPSDLMPATSERWRLTGVALNGGVTTGGVSRLTRTDGGGLWMCWMNGIQLETRAQIKAARAIEALLDGGATGIIVPAFEYAFSPETVTHDDGTPFSDGSLYQSSPVSSFLADGAALRSTVLDVGFVGGVPLEAGERFSITHTTRDKRLYTIARVLESEEDTYSIEIRPPLREATAGGVELDFATPGCVMRLANPDDFLGELDTLHESVANAIWIEHF